MGAPFTCCAPNSNVFHRRLRKDLLSILEAFCLGFISPTAWQLQDFPNVFRLKLAMAWSFQNLFQNTGLFLFLSAMIVSGCKGQILGFLTMPRITECALAKSNFKRQLTSWGSIPFERLSPFISYCLSASSLLSVRLFLYFIQQV